MHNLRNNKKIVQEIGTKIKDQDRDLGSRVGHSVRNRNNETLSELRTKRNYAKLGTILQLMSID